MDAVHVHLGHNVERDVFAQVPAARREAYLKAWTEWTGAPQERLIMVGRDEQDWREKLRAEMERRGMPERDIEEALRRIEGLRDEG